MASLDSLAERACAVAAGAARDVPSPCVSICRMDAATGRCEGCLRTLDEIAAWSRMDDGQKQQVWAPRPRPLLSFSPERKRRKPAGYLPICTKLLAAAGAGAIGLGFSVCGSRQLSRMPTCCTHETVHRGPQNLSVRYSRRRISGV